MQFDINLKGTWKGEERMKKIGISMNAGFVFNLFKYEYEGLKFIEAIKRMGVSHLEFTNFNYGTYGEGLAVYTETFRQISKTIAISLHFSPFARIVGKNLKETWKWKSRLNNIMLFANDVNASWVNMHMGEADRHFDGNFIEMFAETLTEILCPKSEEGNQVQLTIENSFQGNFQKGIEYGTNLCHFDELFKYIDVYGAKKGRIINIGLVIDVAHLNITDEKIESYKKFSERIKAWHLSDNSGRYDKGGIRDPHKVLGHGNIDWEYTIEFIDECCNSTTLIIENQTVYDCIASLGKIQRIRTNKTFNQI